MVSNLEQAKALVHSQVVSNIEAMNSQISNEESSEKSYKLSKIKNFKNVRKEALIITCILDTSKKNVDLMLTTTTTTQAAHIPPFPSWALVYVGVSSLYTHSLGLADNVFHGFIPGTNFLLPIDLCFKYTFS